MAIQLFRYLFMAKLTFRYFPYHVSGKLEIPIVLKSLTVSQKWFTFNTLSIHQQKILLLCIRFSTICKFILNCICILRMSHLHHLLEWAYDHKKPLHSFFAVMHLYSSNIRKVCRCHTINSKWPNILSCFEYKHQCTSSFGF